MEIEKNKLISREDRLQMRNKSFKETGKQALKDLLIVPTIVALAWAGAGIYRAGECVSKYLPESKPRAIWYNEGSDLVKRDIGGYIRIVDENQDRRIDYVQSQPFRGSSIRRAPTGLEQEIFNRYTNK